MNGAGNEAVTDQIVPETAAQQKFRIELNHKLRTPLNAIIGFAELLALRPGSKQKEGDVQQILKASRDMFAIIEKELADPAETKIDEPAPRFSGLRHCDVLYVEDDEVNFTLVERILEYRPGVKIIHSMDGKNGLETAESCQPRMILLDLHLPDMHGSELLRQLQQNPATAKIPVVVLSADAIPSQIERLLSAGARNYLAKPFDIDQFLAVIDEFVSTSRV